MSSAVKRGKQGKGKEVEEEEVVAPEEEEVNSD